MSGEYKSSSTVIKENIFLFIDAIVEFEGCSQKDLAAKLDISVARLNNWIKHRCCPDMETLLNLSRRYNVPLSKIFNEVPMRENILLSSVSDEELQLVYIYRKCDDNGKAALSAAAEAIGSVFS